MILKPCTFVIFLTKIVTELHFRSLWWCKTKFITAFAKNLLWLISWVNSVRYDSFIKDILYSYICSTLPKSDLITFKFNFNLFFCLHLRYFLLRLNKLFVLFLKIFFLRLFYCLKQFLFILFDFIILNLCFIIAFFLFSVLGNNKLLFFYIALLYF